MLSGLTSSATHYLHYEVTRSASWSDSDLLLLERKSNQILPPIYITTHMATLTPCREMHCFHSHVQSRDADIYARLRRIGPGTWSLAVLACETNFSEVSTRGLILLKRGRSVHDDVKGSSTGNLSIVTTMTAKSMWGR